MRPTSIAPTPFAISMRWYQAFDVKPGDKLYLSPDQRVRIW
mgnify:CR=1 FL=1